jgi:hypothetical protein
VTDQSPETGDRPLPPGSPPILVDTSQQPEVPAPQGDSPAPGTVSLVRDDQRPTPTAGEYRAAGYVVPEHDSGPVPDDQTPGLVIVDQRAPQGTVIYDSSPAPRPAEPEVAEAPVDERAEDVKQEPDVEPEQEDAAPDADQPNESPESRRADEAAERAGRQAARAKEPRTANPHDRRTTQGKAWDRGWDAVQSS